jgi:Acetyltransferase (GNAT) domain
MDETRSEPRQQAEFFIDRAPDSVLKDELQALAPANPFFSSGYLSAMASLGTSPWVLGLRRNGRVIAGCPAFFRRGKFERGLEIMSLPEWPEPAAFWSRLLEICRQSGVTQLNVGSFCSREQQIPPLARETSRRSRWEFVLDLTASNWEARIHRSHRANIRQARAAGIEIRRTSDEAACEEHGKLIRASQQRRAARGEAVPSEANTAAHRTYIRAGIAELFQAVRAGEVLSSDLVLKSSDTIYGESAGTSPDGMRCNAAHLVVHEMASAYRREAKKALNLGGCTERDSGLAKFKAYFGASVVALEAVDFQLGGRWTQLSNAFRLFASG